MTTISYNIHDIGRYWAIFDNILEHGIVSDFITHDATIPQVLYLLYQDHTSYKLYVWPKNPNTCTSPRTSFRSLKMVVTTWLPVDRLTAHQLQYRHLCQWRAFSIKISHFRYPRWSSSNCQQNIPNFKNVWIWSLS